MEDLFTFFLKQIIKSFESKFPKPETFTLTSLSNFFSSFDEQISFFSPFIHNLSIASFPKLQNSDLDLLFSTILSIKKCELDPNDDECFNDLIEKIIKKMETCEINKEIFSFLMKLLKGFKASQKKNTKEKFSFLNLYMKISAKINHDVSCPLYINYLHLYAYLLTNYSLKDKEAKNKHFSDKMNFFFSEFNEKVIRLYFHKFCEESLDADKFKDIKSILFSFYVLINQNEKIYTKQANVPFFEILKFLDDQLLKSSQKCSSKMDESLLYIMDSILNLGVIFEENLRNFLIDSNLIKKIIFLMEESKTRKKEKRNSEKLLVNLIKMTEFILNKGFNGNYFEEIYQILDEYVLHLIEPSFNKIFSILEEKKEINSFFWFEKKYINILIKKALSHK